MFIENELISGILPSLLLFVAEVRAVLVQQTVDEGLRNRTIVVAILNVGSCLGIESLCTADKSLCTREGAESTSKCNFICKVIYNVCKTPVWVC